MKYLNSVNKSQFLPLEKSLKNNKTNSKALKLITLKISPEQERNIRYTDEKFEFNPTPSKHPLNNEIKCVDAGTFDANIEQIMLKTAKFATNY